MSTRLNQKAEWLEADGLGGFASGTVSGIRTRRYHALLLTATTPPTGRVVLVNGFEAWTEAPTGKRALSSQCYVPTVIYPDGTQRIESFENEPWPHWTFLLEDGTRIEHEILVTYGSCLTALCWRLGKPRPGVRLCVRPLLSGRDYHALHHENPHLRFDAQRGNEWISWHPYESLPKIIAISNGEYIHHADWYRNFFYEEEEKRGLDCIEDLASPGVFQWDLSKGEAVWILTTGNEVPKKIDLNDGAERLLKKFKITEHKRRMQFPSRLHRAADAYLVRRGKGQTIIAGYPWFTDWGRDTFIALRGLCLATGRLEEAREILLAWAGAISEGMLPNYFADQGRSAEFNSVDASLWYVIVADEFLRTAQRKKFTTSPRDLEILQSAIQVILTGHARGTRYGIHLEDDGLLAAGQKGVQLTWMDARVGDWVVTPRIGKPVEIQALWLNALRIGSRHSNEWLTVFTRGCETFRRRFWNEKGNYLFDVIYVDHQPGTTDATLRPNQIFAVGGLPFAVLEDKQARNVVETVEKQLWTPLGLRSLAPGSPGYCPRYEGDVRQRDGAYHQGTVWPWLIGPFVEAWLRVHGEGMEARKEARSRFLEPLMRHLDEAGLGHISEIADGDLPHIPRGCPFQAWSVGEVLRLSSIT